MSKRLDHWVCIPDEDLAVIEDSPDWDDAEDVLGWALAVQEIILDGLETA